MTLPVAEQHGVNEALFAVGYERWHPYCRSLVREQIERVAACDSLSSGLGTPLHSIDTAIEEAFRAANRSYHERGGKMLRPVLVCLVLEALGYDPCRFATTVSCVEIIHVASLILDDIADDSALRRGGPTAHHMLGTRIATEIASAWINACFMFLQRADDDLGAAQRAKALEEIAWEHWVTGVGVTIDTTWPWLGRFDRSAEEYLQSVLHRTGSYTFRLPFKMAAIAARLSPEQTAQLVQFAEEAGLAYQLVDDILSAQPQDSAWGKAVAEDVSQGKINLQVLFALTRSSRSDAARLRQILTRRIVDGDTLTEAVEIIARSGGFDAAREVAKHHIDVACALLSMMTFLPQRTRAMLDGFIHFVLRRSR